jgi:putative colanic acid biosynthesis UDP-glucose lipid carrier transferase
VAANNGPRQPEVSARYWKNNYLDRASLSLQPPDMRAVPDEWEFAMSDAAQHTDWTVHPAFRDAPAGNADFRSRPGVWASSARLRESRLKWLIDILGAGLGLLILLPFLLLIALLIVLESRGPILFRQRRTGRDGVVFVIYKFRTMNVIEDGSKVTQATREDNRVTRMGKFLRRSSIDELPQLINVLKGDMSLVGPRPHAVAHDEYYGQTVAGYHLRFHAKPGITGLAQISGLRGEIRDIDHMQERIARDLEYIEKWSLKTDARILLSTVISAPFNRFAY